MASIQTGFEAASAATLSMFLPCGTPPACSGEAKCYMISMHMLVPIFSSLLDDSPENHYASSSTVSSIILEGTMKKFVWESIGLNTLKIWGSSCLTFLIWIVPLYTMRYYGIEKKAEHLVSGIACGMITMILLFVFALKEGRKRTFRTMGQKELIAISVFPALIWIVASCLAAKDNVIVMGNTALLGYPLFGLDVSEFTLFTPLPIASVCAVLYALSLYGGYLVGRRIPKKRL